MKIETISEQLSKWHIMEEHTVKWPHAFLNPDFIFTLTTSEEEDDTPKLFPIKNYYDIYDMSKNRFILLDL